MLRFVRIAAFFCFSKKIFIYLQKKDMTATQVFLLFLKKKCTRAEYQFFKNVLVYNNGNKYFKKRKLYKNTFVEDYLSRNNRALNNFMTRLFILAPNLKKLNNRNPRYEEIKREFIEKHSGKAYYTVFIDFDTNGDVKRCKRLNNVTWKEWKGVGMYCLYYRRLWNKFLKENIDDSNKKFNSPFKKGESYNFKLKK